MASLRVHRAVNDAQAVCGLQFCVVFTTGPDVLSAAVDEMNARGVADRPPVLVAADVASGEVDVALGPMVSGRLTNADVDEVIAMLDPTELVRDRVASIVLTLADRAGPGAPHPDAPPFPDVIE
jgi:hypothetical protein